MSCSRRGGSCSGVIEQETRVNRDVLTPYGYSVGQNDKNYTPYSLFTLQSKIAPLIKAMGIERDKEWYMAYDIRRLTTEEGDMMQVCVQLYENGDILPVEDKELHSQLQSIVDTHVYHLDDYCLLLSDRSVLHYKGVHIDHTWYSTILEVYSPSLPLEDVIHEPGALYVRLDRSYSDYMGSDYVSKYNELQVQAYNYILDIYESGAIALGNTEIDDKFKVSWDLTRISDTDTMKGIYKPNWKNRWIAPQPSLFLMKRRTGIPYISFSVGKNNSIRHNISVQLNANKSRYVFLEDEVLVWISTIYRAEKIQAIIANAVSQSTRDVRTDKDYRFRYDLSVSDDEFSMAMLGRDYTEYTDLNIGVVRSTIL